MRRPANAGVVIGAVVVTADGVAPIRLRCGGAACRGSVVLFARVGTQRLAARKLRLGSARFSIPAGRTSTIKVRLNRRGLQAVRKAKRLRAEAVVTVGRTVKRRTITLRARS